MFNGQVLAGMVGLAKLYLDDVIILSPSWTDHQKHIRCMLAALQSEETRRKQGINTKAQKCAWGKSKLEYIAGSHYWEGPSISAICESVGYLRLRNHSNCSVHSNSWFRILYDHSS